MHMKFFARAKGDSFPAVPVFPVPSMVNGMLMSVCVDGLEVYITKAQAMAFFGLVEPSKAAKPMVAAILRETADA